MDYYEKNARSDLSIGGVCIDDNVDRVREIWGNNYSITSPKAIDRNVYQVNQLYQFKDIEMIVKNNKVIYMKTLTPRLKTKRGIHAGSNRQQVLNAYGNDFSQFTKDGILYYEYLITSSEGNKCLLRFAMRNDIVEYVGARIFDPETPKPKPQSTQNSDIDNAKQTFINYHKAITSRNYRTAYNMLSYSQQQRMGDLSYYINGFVNTISSEVTSLTLVSQDSSSCTFNYTLTARDNYQSNKIKVQVFKGEVTMAKDNGYWYIQYARSSKVSEKIE